MRTALTVMARETWRRGEHALVSGVVHFNQLKDEAEINTHRTRVRHSASCARARFNFSRRVLPYGPETAVFERPLVPVTRRQMG